MIVEEAGTLGQRIITLSWSQGPLTQLRQHDVMVGMNDLRTPPSEAKQYYHALKLLKVETALVEIPGASHGITGRPSQLITKVAHVLAWFDQYE